MVLLPLRAEVGCSFLVLCSGFHTDQVEDHRGFFVGSTRREQSAAVALISARLML